MPPPSSQQPRTRSWAWRLAVPVACACAGLLATTSMINARGTDLRGGRHSDLASIVGDQSDRVKETRAQAAAVQADIDRLTKQVTDPLLHTIDRHVHRLTAPTGMTQLSGPGLVVTLTDAPADQEVPDGVDENLFVVHQQDLQAVVNALWAGGAEGISLQDQRIIATTGIKCVGNTVRLHDVPYAPPYVIKAVGDPSALFDALSTSPEVQAYRGYTLPPYNLGWDVREENTLELPAYSEPITLQYAQPSSD
jgi:uncharacterized protein YlxW (UPF0749 family)